MILIPKEIRGRELLENPGKKGEGGSANPDFGRTSFMNSPLAWLADTLSRGFGLGH